MTEPLTRPAPAGSIAAQALRRRTFAVISHPDAGKSTLTEALALHAEVIDSAGAVHGKAGRKGVTSDWMEMERARGISITSAVLQFSYRDHVINLLDTPGHGDFSEDTYRVLAAVDAAVMLLDASKGLEAQTLKLFDVCRSRGIPVLTFVNKWDVPGREALELLDEVEQTIGLRPMPVTWPVGIAGDLRGVVECATGELRRYARTAGGATKGEVEVLTPEQAAEQEPLYTETVLDELELLREIGAGFDEDDYLAGTATPVLFGAARHGVGVGRLLDALVDLAPAPAPRPDAEGTPRELDTPLSGLVFKVQAGMDRSHRDRTAFLRINSGRFERGMVLTHAGTGRPFATKYAQAVFGQQRTTLEEAFPGDIVGLVNAGALRPGDTLYADEPVQFPAIPSFAPEHFAVVRAKDAGRYKQFRRGISQLDSEGVIQVLRSDRRGDQAPVLAAVGPLQFEVVTARLADEFGAPVSLEQLNYTVARLTDEAGALVLNKESETEVLQRSVDGALLAVFVNKWRMETIRRKHEGVMMEPLLAGAVDR
ncbi:peptide chain release factor 3 [Pseudonocardia broussonetiae]|uniref:Peptide chain release factor 3 n=1 Tax=Pseudonocardia broussonetiae TaxID=2736640 RepID=A0A6M6JHR1_9PSEU|nr:peptide chain release factor 3 [Pseudonocardia broussonetiae]QJY46705.1 peptide chain release factor 3 [Pseudonocardia broussonetiae]